MNLEDHTRRFNIVIEIKRLKDLCNAYEKNIKCNTITTLNSTQHSLSVIESSANNEEIWKQIIYSVCYLEDMLY